MKYVKHHHTYTRFTISHSLPSIHNNKKAGGSHDCMIGSESLAAKGMGMDADVVVDAPAHSYRLQDFFS